MMSKIKQVNWITFVLTVIASFLVAGTLSSFGGYAAYKTTTATFDKQIALIQLQLESQRGEIVSMKKDFTDEIKAQRSDLDEIKNLLMTKRQLDDLKNILLGAGIGKNLKVFNQ